MDIQTCLRQGVDAQKLVNQCGRQAVIDEIQELIVDDMADVALTAAIALDDRRLVALASRIILCGNYGPKATRLAAENNGDVDLRKIREKILQE
ncbi:MAG: hypothetical protein AAB972_02785 [Patescibacteria group bacterium]